MTLLCVCVCVCLVLCEKVDATLSINLPTCPTFLTVFCIPGYSPTNSFLEGVVVGGE